jgi:hypothetical protein
VRRRHPNPPTAEATSPLISRDIGGGAFVDVATCVDPLGVVLDYAEVVHQFHITYTNLSNGLTYSPNSSGPGTIDLMADAVVLQKQRHGVERARCARHDAGPRRLRRGR